MDAGREVSREIKELRVLIPGARPAHLQMTCILNIRDGGNNVLSSATLQESFAASLRMEATMSSLVIRFYAECLIAKFEH